MTYGSNHVFRDVLQWKHWGTKQQEQSSLPGKSPTSSHQQTCMNKDKVSKYLKVRLICPSVLRIQGSPDEYDLPKLSELVQQLIYERVVKVVVRAGGAEWNHDGAIWRPLQGDDVFVDLVPSLWVDFKDVYVHYCHHRPTDGGVGIEQSHDWWMRHPKYCSAFSVYVTVLCWFHLRTQHRSDIMEDCEKTNQ